MQFREIIGQDQIKQQLIQSVKDGRVSHAQLFLSHDGSGALPLAVAYAQYLNCLERGEADSCGNCTSCRKYSRYIHPDLHFSYPFFGSGKDDVARNYLDQWRTVLQHDLYFDMDTWRAQFDAGNKQPNINIAECHDIIKKLSFKAFEAETKVLIMWLPEYLDKEGNTLLKLIEEPPENTLFILVANHAERILSTILSRTQIVKIRKLTDEAVSGYLTQELGLGETQAAGYSFLADGNLVEAKRLAANIENDHAVVFASWLRTAFSNKGLELISFSEKAALWGRENQKNFLRYGIQYLRECCLLISGADALVKLPPQVLETAKKLSAHVLTLAMAEALIGVLEKAHYHIERNANAKILFLDVSLQLVKIINFKTLPQGTQYIYH
ncbi:hypothetical protein C7T94_02510 [Pedobacter yulinensis]|uniref:DNA polymerase III subunit delta n=1 Tax=Pedobacter yulinensis TaxID=2126353 RepID=A0A2T3HRF6_9SPHI|nr:DNA polymerase III subunit [Pedobacter yulinensis]PST85009.1 hypothetical protein C7T94_02510 [Pedobacter yulinensis]